MDNLRYKINKFIEIKRKGGLNRAIRASWFHLKRDLIANNLKKLYAKGKRRIYNIKYEESYPDLYKVIWVDPSKIRFAKSVDITKRGFIKGGDWDKKAKSVSNRSKLKAIKKHFEESYSWEETDIYSNLMRHVKEKGNMDDCHSMEDLKNKYENQVENLYENIKKNGYKTQVELGNTDQSKPGIGEICVSIGRNGEIIHGNRGWHRFTIARILDIDKIPVQIILRHKKWQELRNEVVNADNFDDLSHEAKNHIEHPDLQDLIPNRWIERFDIDDT